MTPIETFLKLIEDGLLRIDDSGNIYSNRTGKKLSTKNNRFAFRVSDKEIVKVNASELIYCYFNKLIEIPDRFFIKRKDGNIDNCLLENLYLFTCYEHDGKKHCQKCKQTKDVSEFYKSVNEKDGYNEMCKECFIGGVDKVRVSEYHKKHYKKNSRKLLNYQKEYRNKNRDIINKRSNMRMKNNPIIRIAHNLRNRIGTAIHGYTKSNKTEILLGCNFEYFFNYVESHFCDGMTWDNYGISGWHLDHIVPCAAFDLSKEEEQKKCFHYTNLRPLWAKENLSKNSFYDGKRYSFNQSLRD